MKIKELNEARIATLHPILQPLVRAFIKRCEAAGNHILITCGMRTHAEQNALYAQGRTKPGRKVTWVKGGGSYHQFGLAFDIVPLDAMGKAEWDGKNPEWKAAACIAEALGFEWGGRWAKTPDMPHFQMTFNYKCAELQALYAKGGLKAVNAAVELRAKP